jgi:hypothetical protein
MKRGPKSKLEVDSTLQKRLCDVLAKGNTIKTAAAVCQVSERSVHSWISSNPSFAAAVFRARGIAKTKLIAVIREAALNDWRAAAWILERSWPDEYARTERVEQIGEKADEDKTSVKIFYNTGGQQLSELLSFPIHFSMKQGHDSPKKQRRLLEQTTKKASAPETISDAPPPKVVNPALTGSTLPSGNVVGCLSA